ncbi:hypothetical protein G6F63_016406 [Rhizopus arrhizus]|nr:hypothetical protein G6F63_016406 [Rhizopus arrhizus]
MPSHADDAEQQAGQRRWQAEALQRAGDHQQREDQQQVDQLMAHQCLPWGSNARRMRVPDRSGKPFSNDPGYLIRSSHRPAPPPLQAPLRAGRRRPTRLADRR